MKRIVYKSVATVMLITFAVFMFGTSVAEAQVKGRSVNVTGNAVIDVIPDQVTVRFGIVSVDLDPETARTENGRVSAATMNAVRDLGIEERKMQVNALRLQPFVEYDPATRQNVDRGFQAIRDVTVELIDTDMLPELISGIMAHGANRIHGISYGIQNSDEAEEEALRKALLNAKAKAQVMAETLGARLGVVLQISEQGVVLPSPHLFQVDMASARGAKLDEMAVDPDAYAGGELQVSANVSVVFALLPPSSRHRE